MAGTPSSSIPIHFASCSLTQSFGFPILDTLLAKIPQEPNVLSNGAKFTLQPVSPPLTTPHATTTKAELSKTIYTKDCRRIGDLLKPTGQQVNSRSELHYV